MSNVVAPIKRHHAKPIVMCGGCKNTGVRHEWNANGDYLPTGEECPSCGGTCDPRNKVTRIVFPTEANDA